MRAPEPAPAVEMLSRAPKERWRAERRPARSQSGRLPEIRGRWAERSSGRKRSVPYWVARECRLTIVKRILRSSLRLLWSFGSIPRPVISARASTCRGRLAQIVRPVIAIIRDALVGRVFGFDDGWRHRQDRPGEHGAIGKCAHGPQSTKAITAITMTR